MKKILSICIPSYNMEEYLSRCVDSMIVDEVLDQLEIIIVNDGSKDGTLSVANDFKERYPQSIVVVDKPNGHYGSCINASLKVATAKYFRIVDADDWVDSNALKQLVNLLSKIDVDCVWTKYTTFYEGGSSTLQLDVPFGEIVDLNQFSVNKKCLKMHCLLFSRDLLQRIGYKQTEGICYTDLEYAYYPLSCAKTLYFMDISLYQYYYGREGQSMEDETLINNNDHFAKLVKSLKNEHLSRASFFNKNESFLFSVSIQDSLLAFALPMYILYHKYDKEKEVLFREVVGLLKKEGTLSFPEMLGKGKVYMINLWYNTGMMSRYLMWPFRLYDKLRQHH